MYLLPQPTLLLRPETQRVFPTGSNSYMLSKHIRPLYQNLPETSVASSDKVSRSCHPPRRRNGIRTQSGCEPELLHSKRGRKTESARRQQDALITSTSPPSPHLDWLARNACICNGQRSSEISCGRYNCLDFYTESNSFAYRPAGYYDQGLSGFYQCFQDKIKQQCALNYDDQGFRRTRSRPSCKREVLTFAWRNHEKHQSERRWLPSGLLLLVVWQKLTDVSETLPASDSLPWWWRKQAPAKYRWTSTKLHSVTNQKTDIHLSALRRKNLEF
jgi:hypothetical protein